MADLYLAPAVIAQQMLDDFKNITGVTVSLDQLDDDNVLKALTFSGAISAVYAQIQRLANDQFSFSASDDALRNMLRSRSLPSQAQASPSHMQIQFTFSGPATIPLGAQASRDSDGQVYTTIETGSGDVGSPLTLFVESVNDGNITNLDKLSQPFSLLTPISGVVTACTNTSLGLDGRDLESSASMAGRVLEADQDSNTGGNAEAYQEWAKAASDQVVTATVLRRPRGPDTVDVVITSGTTDIASAVENGQAIVRLPSAALVAEVLAYIQALNPITDDVEVYGPTEIPLNVTFNYSLYTETSANRAFCNNIITQQINIYLYSANPKDVLTPSAIERLVDQAIGDQIKERNCSNLNGGTSSYTVPNANVLIPGTITLGTI